MKRRSFLRNIGSVGLFSFLTSNLQAANTLVANDGSNNSTIINKHAEHHFLLFSDFGKRIYFDLYKTLKPQKIINGFTFIIKERQSLNVSEKHLDRYFPENQHAIILVQLGDKKETAFAKEFYDYLKNNNRSFNIIASIPFAYQGMGYRERALDFVGSCKNDQRIHLIDDQELRNQYGNMRIIDLTKLKESIFKNIYQNKILAS